MEELLSHFVSMATAQALEAMEQQGAIGLPIIIKNKRFSRVQVISGVLKHVLGDGPVTPKTPKVFVGVRDTSLAPSLLSRINQGLPNAVHGSLLITNVQPPDDVGFKMGSFITLGMNKWLTADAFDLMVYSAIGPLELKPYRRVFSKFTPRFTLLMISRDLYDQGELANWPGFMPPYFVEDPPPNNGRVTPVTA